MATFLGRVLVYLYVYVAERRRRKASKPPLWKIRLVSKQIHLSCGVCVEWVVLSDGRNFDVFIFFISGFLCLSVFSACAFVRI